MAYRFNTAESVPDNVRRIASEEIEFAISHLRKSGGTDRVKDIHEARKAIKRLRALLRLVRPQLGRWFRRENRALRDVGHSLSDLRDASILLDTFDGLPKDSGDSKRLEPLRSGLQRQKRAKEQAVNTQEILRGAADNLRKAGERVAEWPLDSDGFEAIAEGLGTEYRDGRKAMSRAIKANDSLLYHEWRKRAKNLLFHVRLLANVIPETLERREKQLHQLETALGDDHNLLILRQHLDSHPKGFGGKKVVQHSLHLVGARETELRTKAEALGEQVYSRRPKEFVELLRAGWESAAASHLPRRRRKTAAG
jgi:CHAD domain-containing protein